MKNIQILLFSSVISLIMHCTPMQVIESPVSKSEIESSGSDYRVVASSSNQCKKATSFKRWKILFATYPLSTPDSQELFPNRDKSYRVYESSDWQDVAISIVLGLTTTMTRDTLVVETCGVSEEYLNQLAAKIPETNPLFQEKLREALIEEKIQMNLAERNERKEEESDSNNNSEPLSPGNVRVILKDGKSIQGKILSQDSQSVIFLDADNTEKEISKKEIQKIKFR
ncbi:MAG: hypothetical protein JJT78_01380 [Leptospira sp.]|nr:hypothetical protein [Leptospira sp.]